MRLNHAGITVADMERSLAFYRDSLGLKMYMDVMESGPDADRAVMETGVLMRAVCLTDDAGNMVELFEFKSPKAKKRPAQHLKYTSTGLVEISLIVDDMEKLERDLKKNGFGFKVSPYIWEKEGWKVKLAIALDPDGVVVEFSQVLGGPQV
jgi:glyoxylase I family protein